MSNITIDEVYEIAAEVAQETITKFLSNLVKLVPNAGDITEDIKQAQYDAYRASKKKVNERVSSNKGRRNWDEEIEESEEDDDYMRRVYEEGRAQEDDEDEDPTEAEFDAVAGKGKKSQSINDIFPDDFEAAIGLQDDHHMPSDKPAAD